MRKALGISLCAFLLMAWLLGLTLLIWKIGEIKLSISILIVVGSTLVAIIIMALVALAIWLVME